MMFVVGMIIFADAIIGSDCNSKQKEKERITFSQKSAIIEIDERVQRLYSVWSNSLSKSASEKGQSGISRLDGQNFPDAPHLENCRLRVEINRRLDSRAENESSPPWTIWKGMLDNFPLTTDEQQRYLRHQLTSESAYLPWVWFLARSQTFSYLKVFGPHFVVR